MSVVTNDPLTKFTMEISKKLSRFLTKDLVDQLDDEEDVYSDGQDVESVVKYHDELYFTKTFPLDVEYSSPAEPDGNKVKLWLQGNNLGNQLNDISTFDHHATITGEPILVSGNPFDLGLHTGTIKSIALRLNRPGSPYVNAEYLTIPDTADIQVSGIATGMTWFIRFRLASIASNGGLSRTLYEKIDDSTPNNGVVFKVDSNGKLIVVVKRSGTEYKKETASGTIAIDTVYEVFITYAVSGNTIHVYVNNVDKTLSTNADATGFHTTLTNHDGSIFRRGAGSSGGYTYGDFYDFTVWKEKVCSATEVSHHYTNKWTTADIEFGKVLVSNYSATFAFATPPIGLSFTPSSFTTTSFTS